MLEYMLLASRMNALAVPTGTPESPGDAILCAIFCLKTGPSLNKLAMP